VSLTSTFAALKDTLIDDTNTTTNYDTGGLSIGWVGGKSTSDERILAEFDLATPASGLAIPADAIIDSATLALVCLQASLSADAATIYRITTSDWLEAQATWLVRKTSTNWGTAGGDYSTPSVAFTLPTTTGSKSYTITTIVADGLASRGRLVEILMRKDTEGAGSIALYYDAENATPGNRPVLTVLWTPRRRTGGAF
jgi:hypothetical protein